MRLSVRHLRLLIREASSRSKIDGIRFKWLSAADFIEDRSPPPIDYMRQHRVLECFRKVMELTKLKKGDVMITASDDRYSDDDTVPKFAISLMLPIHGHNAALALASFSPFDDGRFVFGGHYGRGLDLNTLLQASSLDDLGALGAEMFARVMQAQLGVL
jgi:hypothetical protein